ncbi:tRNA (adenosine(37)-N6)-threonylcarbamoyltransferase complex dimerization subunit type 1 TsaB [Paenibacillus sp. FSL H7-0331]|uniref:tRNA (adenosine(37)-N6)-threonylcarbamoyltransferase complex dimerization subunit type 1 TsaB n=1 Tax=Paenibacillus sp. FSL H7-0331 TaxID=1920421 RepID=UPI00096ED1B0|nr:tRNA (adenosine(37)-N6)-threonylcarbamoyltransferase complex dimerization subunit type 1 TsaB [Paenibacillus sp. FSL H7-0331]OMF16126.1 tRNA (adenosine(37)-N6)-threonylcarbamoyltransferase complex dimerization subunit type 1 TsaB [Paenibacillus sp. FSL H7-0331]
MNNDQINLQGTLLAIDTSTSSMSVALTRGGELLGELNSNAERNHSIHLLPHIQQVLASAGLHSRDVDAFAVGVGPGSYTGVRIGVTVAKTLAWTHQKVLLAVSSLEALALGGVHTMLESPSHAGKGRTSGASVFSHIEELQEKVWVVPMFEARRGQAFTALYQAANQQWSCLATDGIRLMSSWSEELLERAMDKSTETERPDRIIFTGETGLHEATIEHFSKSWTGAAEIVHHEMRARYTADLALEQWKHGDTREPHGLIPNYTQLTEAEVKWKAQAEEAK